MVNWNWEMISEAKWWDPLMILWINNLPEPWRLAEVVKTEKEANKKITLIKEKQDVLSKKTWFKSILDQIEKWEVVELKLILKADSSGSLEALKYAMTKITMPENIEIKIIHADIWNVTNSDIVLANASNWVIILFWVLFSAMLKKKATQLKVNMKAFEIIYEIIDYIEDLAKWLVKIEEKEVIIWNLKTLWIFYTKWKEMIIGWKVLSWKIVNNAFFRVFKWEKDEETGEPIPSITGRVTSLKKEQENVKEISVWHECWMRIKSTEKIEKNDELEFYVIE